jgi:competence ComEA-like helix-hairpin-helix protein
MIQNNTRKGAAFFLLSVLLIGAPITVAAQNTELGLKGREVAGSACTLCHGLGYLASLGRSKTEWQDLVSDMVGRGAQLQPDEFDAIVQYLTENFGPARAANVQSPTTFKVNVNKASAKELSDALGLSSEDAATIIRYRMEKGSFREWSDFSKVPGIDLKKLETRKDRLTY